MHDDRELTEARIHRALEERLRPSVHQASLPLAVEAWAVDGEPVPVATALAGTYAPFEVGRAWGEPWGTTWFRMSGEIPSEWSGRRVEAVIDLGFDPRRPGFQAEGLVFTVEGEPVKGLAPRNHHVPVTSLAGTDGAVELLVEAASNPEIFHVDSHGRVGVRFLPTELGDVRTAGDDLLYRLERADLVLIDEDAWGLVHDVEVLVELMEQLPAREPRRHVILRALERCIDVLDAVSSIADAAREARTVLAPALAAPANASAHTLSAVGHAHIDSAWLWPLRETVRKVSRTFANVLQLQEEYPECVFAASQAQQYAWVKQHQPAIYDRIAKAVEEGRWVPVGGMWVESDANLPGGEALARQLTFGKRFFLEEFGVETEEVWLPDSFGYTGAFPQLARLAGARWFLTQKLSWNNTNRFPHHTFWWEGIDGTRIFTHFPPVDTYNAELSAAELAHAVGNDGELGRASRSLVPYGHGDGGGGPTREMLERARRLTDLEGSPRVVTESPAAFFRAAEESYPDAPVWSGELYLEAHRGTFTSQAGMKSGNRRSEHLLREAELLATAASCQAGADYPYDELERLWRTVLLHQFHDILPGSSIAQVHREANETYREVARDLVALTERAMAALAPAGRVVANTAPFDRDEVIVVDDPPADGDDVAQRLADGRTAIRVRVPGSAIAPLEAVAHDDEVVADGTTLRNDHVEVVIGEDGTIVSLLDLVTGRQLLPPGERCGLLQLHPDRPARWDAWDLDHHYRRAHIDLDDCVDVEVMDTGPLVGAVRVRREFRDSHVTQVVRLRAGSPMVELVTDVEWHEQDSVLKLALPVDVHADHVTSEIQFGHIARPTHANTSWDAAHFEDYAHRWLHVGEPGYGVAIVNDAVYGHDTKTYQRTGGGRSTTVRMTLLRGPRFPDPATDLGRHRFVVGLVPNADLRAASRYGRALNLPLRLADGLEPDGVATVPEPLVSAEGEQLAIEAVKLADDRSGDLVVRLYERSGARAQGVLSTSLPVDAAWSCDLLERPHAELPVEDGRVELTLRAFEIVTLRLARTARP